VFVPRTTGALRLYSPSRAQVRADRKGRPQELAGVPVEVIREEWLVEDRWWTAHPFRRRYFELVLADGRNAVVFCLLGAGESAPAGWFRQRG
jgi:hypothetical protein